MPFFWRLSGSTVITPLSSYRDVGHGSDFDTFVNCICLTRTRKTFETGKEFEILYLFI